MTLTFALFFGFILLVIAGGTAFIGWISVNSVRFHRSGIYRVTSRQVVLLAGALLLMVVALGTMTWGFLRSWTMDRSPSVPIIYVALAIIAFGVVAIPMALAVNRQQARTQRARNEATEALFERIRTGQSLEEPLFVYLRPFSAAEARTTTERMVVELLEQRGTLFCVAESGLHYGIGRLALRDDEWQPAVLKVCERATAIVIHPAASAGTLWELSQLASRGWLSRTLFFMPPAGPLPGHAAPLLARFATPEQRAQMEERDLHYQWDQARARAREAGVELPEHRNEGGLFRVTAGQVEWVTPFGRELQFGKPPTLERQKLEPILDALTTQWEARARFKSSATLVERT